MDVAAAHPRHRGSSVDGMLTYDEVIQKPREFLSATGLSATGLNATGLNATGLNATGLNAEEAERLLVEFIKADDVVYPPTETKEGKARQRQVGGGAKGNLATNRIYSTSRIRVEHAIAGVKRCRILKDILRNTKAGFSDLIIEVACALHNFRIASRQPAPDFNLLDLCA